MKTLTIGDLTLGEGLPKICVPLTGENMDALLEEVRQVKQLPCQLVEWRADYMLDAREKTGIQEKIEEVKQALGRLRTELDMPMIFTIRTAAEGGQAKLTKADYYRLNQEIARSKIADFIDLQAFEKPGAVDEEQVRDLIKLAHENGTRVLLSNHDFEATPELEELLTRFFVMQELGPDLMKLAVMPKTEDDVFNLLEVASLMRDQYGKIPFIAISMGELGAGTRICGGEFGSVITFAAGSKASAPGQLSAEALSEYLIQYYEKGKTERE